MIIFCAILFFFLIRNLFIRIEQQYNFQKQNFHILKITKNKKPRQAVYCIRKLWEQDITLKLKTCLGNLRLKSRLRKFQQTQIGRKFKEVLKITGSDLICVNSCVKKLYWKLKRERIFFWRIFIQYHRSHVAPSFFSSRISRVINVDFLKNIANLPSTFCCVLLCFYCALVPTALTPHGTEISFQHTLVISRFLFLKMKSLSSGTGLYRYIM